MQQTWALVLSHNSLVCQSLFTSYPTHPNLSETNHLIFAFSLFLCHNMGNTKGSVLSSAIVCLNSLVFVSLILEGNVPNSGNKQTNKTGFLKPQFVHFSVFQMSFHIYCAEAARQVCVHARYYHKAFLKLFLLIILFERYENLFIQTQTSFLPFPSTHLIFPKNVFVLT